MADTPITFDEAKALVEGALGLEMAKYPLRFACATYFGVPPKEGEELRVNNGTASLLLLGGKPTVLTCSHVLQGYRERLAEEPTCIFQVGDCALNPLEQLTKESAKLDFALIGLTEAQAAEIAATQGDQRRYFLEPHPWPPGPVTEDDFVAFGGYPGDLRRATSFNELSFGSFSSGASKASAVGGDYLVTHFDREYWVQHKFEPEPAYIRGLSGGPAFALRKSAETGIMTYEFIGHVYQFSEDFELLYIRLASALDV